MPLILIIFLHHKNPRNNASGGSIMGVQQLQKTSHFLCLETVLLHLERKILSSWFDSRAQEDLSERYRWCLKSLYVHQNPCNTNEDHCWVPVCQGFLWQTTESKAGGKWRSITPALGPQGTWFLGCGKRRDNFSSWVLSLLQLDLKVKYGQSVRKEQYSSDDVNHIQAGKASCLQHS